MELMYNNCMNVEIERKFMVKEIPAKYLNQTPMEYERYYIYVGVDIELRVQKKGNKYEMERKVKSGELSRDTLKIPITEGEFTALSKNITKALLRRSYLLENSNFSTKEYAGDYHGLIRAEFEFNNEKEAKNFISPEWCGNEITASKLGKDSKLIKLTPAEFKEELSKHLTS